MKWGNPKSIKKALCEFWLDEEGQTTTEYILMVAIVVAIIFKFKGQMEGQMDKTQETLERRTNG